jgi:hypothetical protein
MKGMAAALQVLSNENQALEVVSMLITSDFGRVILCEKLGIESHLIVLSAYHGA